LFDQENSLVVTPHITLLHRDADHAELEVHWPRQLHYFSGHFPDAPVLPGVAQLHWAIKIARDLFAMPPAFNGMHGLKFQHVVLPDDITRLKLHYDAQKQSLSFTFASATRQYSSGRILFHG
jgi:3-hydroxymyristoyl/3-hydroxydecanoyl-(acyl carrier protein) dehydratase